MFCAVSTETTQLIIVPLYSLSRLSKPCLSPFSFGGFHGCPSSFLVFLLASKALSFLSFFLFQLLSTVTTSISVFNKTPYIYALFFSLLICLYSLIWFCFHGVMNVPTPLDPREGLCAFLFIHQD